MGAEKSRIEVNIIIEMDGKATWTRHEYLPGGHGERERVFDADQKGFTDGGRCD